MLAAGFLHTMAKIGYVFGAQPDEEYLTDPIVPHDRRERNFKSYAAQKSREKVTSAGRAVGGGAAIGGGLGALAGGARGGAKGALVGGLLGAGLGAVTGLGARAADRHNIAVAKESVSNPKRMREHLDRYSTHARTRQEQAKEMAAERRHREMMNTLRRREES